MARRVALPLIALAALVLVASAPRPVYAATFTITKTADTADGACNSDCSLREAVIAANARAGPDLVNIPGGVYQVSIPGTSEDAAATGDIDINDDLSITGAGAASTIVQGAGGQDGYGTDRIFHVRLGSVSLSGVTITKGRLEFGNGAGVAVEQGASLSVRDGVISDNRTGRDGGGIYNRGRLFLKNISLLNNIGGWGGGLSNEAAESANLESVTIRGNQGSEGGGLYNSYYLISAVNLEVTGNSAAEGGGVANVFGNIQLTSVVVNDNHSDGAGGGILNRAGTLSVTDSTISRNSGTFSAGGIANFPQGSDPARAQLSLTRVTISENITPGDGGGIYNLWGDASLTDVTVSTNSASTGPGILTTTTSTGTITASTLVRNPSGASAGIKNDSMSTVRLSNTILAGIAGSDNCEGVITSDGHNLDNGSGCDLSGNGDISGSDPLLGPLEDNGGPSFTHELLPASPAIDAGDNAACPATDERGANRPIGAACDMGAYEFGDTDADKWSDAAENMIGTDALSACGPNAWPPDIDNNGLSDITDVAAFVNYFGQAVPPAPPRYNVAPDPPNGFVDITDIARILNYFGKGCA